ncbi:MAG TPA: prolipoprotein diacylglyceryl transferase [Chitinophagales bacterium]|nr:prolipoprotein diacylglyceryl transferase [Chitinophagales bacterium]
MQLFIHWSPSPDAISFGIFSIQWYGILWGLSLMASFFIATRIFKTLKRDDEKITLIIQYVFIGGIIGARLAHVFFYNPSFYLANPFEIIAVWKGGLASHGGVVGGLVGLYVFCRYHTEFTFFWLLDIGIICTLVLASLVRFGNLMNSELCGKVTDVPWAFIFHKSYEVTDGMPRHPVVLYESIAYMALQLLMLFLFSKYKESRPGIYIVTFLVGVFTVRFFLEFYKEPDGALILNTISKTQLLNLPFIAAGIVLAYFVMNDKLKYKAPKTLTTQY